MWTKSLCDLGELCVSVVDIVKLHHRDSEDTEDAQRKSSYLFSFQNLKVLLLTPHAQE